MTTVVNLNNSTPAAPAGNINVTWQNDNSSPLNVSAYVPVTAVTPGGVNGQVQYNNSGALSGAVNLNYNLGTGITTFGSVGSVSGTIQLSGSGSGSAIIQVASAAGTPNALQLPTLTGTAGNLLYTDGNSPQQLTWSNGLVWTSASDLTVQQLTAATSLANHNSLAYKTISTYWNGSASTNNTWTIQDVLTAGTNPTSILTFSQSGTIHPQVKFTTTLEPGINGSATSWAFSGAYASTLAATATGMTVNVSATSTAHLLQGMFVTATVTSSGTVNNAGVTTIDINAAASPSGTMNASSPVIGIGLQNQHNGAGTITASFGYVGSQSAASGGTVTNFYNFYSQAGALSNSSVVTNYTAFRSEPPTISTGASVTNLYGLYVKAQGGIATTLSAGVYLENAGAGATDYAIFSAGGQAHFVGNLDAGNLITTAASAATTGSQVAVGTTAGFGTGAAGTAVTTTTKGGGTGPTTPQTVVNYLEIFIGATAYWIPLVQ